MPDPLVTADILELRMVGAVETSPDGLHALAAIANRVAPLLSGVPVLSHWAGLRPMSPDLLPILGRDPEFPRLLYACGFSRNGILFGPWSGALIAKAIWSERSFAAFDLFSIRRFAVE